MTQYSRLLIPAATYFFTVRLQQRGDTLLTDHIESLRFAYAKAVQEFPVTCLAMVVMPDHLHAIWTEPAGGVWYAERWRRIKTRFAHALHQSEGQKTLPQVKRERTIWQRRFDEHALLTADDFRRALMHCETDPVRHGLVTDAALWPYSSFSKGKVRSSSPNSGTTRAHHDRLVLA